MSERTRLHKTQRDPQIAKWVDSVLPSRDQFQTMKELGICTISGEDAQKMRDLCIKLCLGALTDYREKNNFKNN